MNLNQLLINKFNNSISNNIKLSNYSWFNLGGHAEFFFQTKKQWRINWFFKDNKKYKLNITTLGAGSNTLIRDNGVKGVVIKLGPNYSNINLLNKNTLEIGAATLDKKIAKHNMSNWPTTF